MSASAASRRYSFTSWEWIGRGRPVVVEVLEEPLPGDLLAVAQHLGHAPVPGVHLVGDPALAGEHEGDLGSRDARVPVPEGREAVGAVVTRVFVVADADERRLQQLGDGRQHLVARDAGEREVGVDALPHRREGVGERGQAVELHPVAERGPVGVVAVLEPTPLVAPHGLEVGVGVVADAHVGPGRRDHDGADAFEGGGVGHPRAAAVVVAEALAPPHPSDRQLLGRAVPERRDGDGAHGGASCPSEARVQTWSVRADRLRVGDDLQRVRARREEVGIVAVLEPRARADPRVLPDVAVASDGHGSARRVAHIAP